MFAGRSFRVIGDDTRAGCQRRFDERIDLEASFDGFLGEQTGGEHDRWIAGIGATRDGGNQNAAVADFACRPS